jgi:glycine/D-amino acid oxidase-like deaminating enzyme
VIGVTGDYRPFVGRLAERLTGRKTPPVTDGRKKGDESQGRWDLSGVRPGEWISAGYCGDGMVWAWKCGTALGRMLLGEPADEFPEELLAQWDRVRKADLMNLLDEIV